MSKLYKVNKLDSAHNVYLSSRNTLCFYRINKSKHLIWKMDWKSIGILPVVINEVLFCIFCRANGDVQHKIGEVQSRHLSSHKREETKDELRHTRPGVHRRKLFHDNIELAEAGNYTIVKTLDVFRKVKSEVMT